MRAQPTSGAGSASGYDAPGDSAPRLRSDGWGRREAILDAAHAALLRDRRTTIQDIAEAAGVGRSTIYRYFPTRGDLERALSQRSGSVAPRAPPQAVRQGPGGSSSMGTSGPARPVAQPTPTRLNPRASAPP